MKRIESLLSREIGLSPRSIGSGAIEAAVKTRLRACGVLDVSEYLARVERDPVERSALVEEIVVPETRFLRDEEVFTALRRHVTGWLGSERVLRVLSLPCATGEEAYSVAITLLEAGLRESRFSVRGVDVSERALAAARRAVYGKNSFRGCERLQQSAYFEAAADGWQLLEPARRAVAFARGNVLDGTAFSAAAFDVILCRNLLIYLDPRARARALDNLYGWLADDGLVFAGHAEAVELMDARFQKSTDAAPFGYVKLHALAPVRSGATTALNRVALAQRGPTATDRRGGSRASGGKLAPAAGGEQPAARASLAHATELANRGRLRDAELVCERFIAEAGATPEAYCLLGIISNAAGKRDGAISYFNKSLYLDQNYHDALLHLALLHEQRGELPTAANFKRRAERARRGETK